MSDEINLQPAFDRASELAQKDAQGAIKLFQDIVASDASRNSDAIKIQEQAIYEIGKLQAKQGSAKELENLLVSIRPFFQTIPKAKTEKIVWTLIGMVSSLDLQINLCKDSIQWAQNEKRTFLRHKIESKLAELLLEAKKFLQALEVINPLLSEVKRLDDKALLVDIHLVESKVYHSLRNLPKARAALTSARTAANSIYCPPLLQSRIDMQSGTLHTEEKDYKTGASYFFEAFEGYNSLDHEDAVKALKYMLLCKIMINKPSDVHSILSGKLALTYVGREVEAMRAIANAYKERSLHAFENCKQEYQRELQGDPLIDNHLTELYDTMLQQNICRIIEPFSRVEITHVAELINLNVAMIEKKLSQMILDKKFNGILDQGNGCLILFPDPPEEKIYQTSLDTIENMSRVVDTLYNKAQKLN